MSPFNSLPGKRLQKVNKSATALKINKWLNYSLRDYAKINLKITFKSDKIIMLKRQLHESIFVKAVVFVIALRCIEPLSNMLYFFNLKIGRASWRGRV